MVKIAFQTSNLNIRGACTAIYDYADYSEKILGYSCIIIVPIDYTLKSELKVIEKFKNRFEIYEYISKEYIDNILQEQSCDILYTIKYGRFDGIFSHRFPTLVHCCFEMSQPHGDMYIAVSNTLAKKYGRKDSLSHIVRPVVMYTKKDARDIIEEKYGICIPRDKIVIGRHGGHETFNLDEIREGVLEIVQERNDIFFLFVNTPIWCDNDNIMHIDKFCDTTFKELYLSACDGILEASTLGHTFGLNVAEGSVANRPIFVYNGWVWNNAHLEILGENGIKFKDKREFKEKVLNFNPKDYEGKDLNYYRAYYPEKIIPLFDMYVQKTVKNFKMKKINN